MSVLPASETEDSGAASVLPADEIDATPSARVETHVDPAAPESAAAVWARTMENATPITKEEVRGDREPEPATVPDRVLVAPELTKLIEAQAAAPEPTATESRLAAIEAALTPAAEAPPAPDLTQEVAALRDLILSDRADAAAAVEQQELDSQFTALKEGVIANIRSAPERFPALIALDQEENVYHTLVGKLKAGEAVSEDDIASEANAKLMAVYERIHSAVTGKTEPSEEPQSSDAVDTDTTTLTPTLTGTDTPQSIDSLINSGLSRREAAARVWENIEK